MSSIHVQLKPGKEKPVKAFHPWIFSGAIDQIDEDFKPGDLVKVYSSQNEFLGTGYLNPRSNIAVRMLTFRDETVGREFFLNRIREARALRDRFLPPDTNAYRLIHSEGDFLPGLIVDRYADYLAVQFLTAGMEKLKPEILSALKEVCPAKGIYEHDDESMRKFEGLGKGQGMLAGDKVPDYVEIEEYGHRFLVDVKEGQKTGFFLDQRENRKLAGDFAKGKRVLNCFAYTGGFSIYAAKAGALSVTSVEIQERAINTMKSNFELNGFPSPLSSPTGRGEPACRAGRGEGKYRFVRQDVFDFLREERDTYDLIILDPPAFCKHQSQIQQAARGYKDINLQAMKRLAPDGLLFTFSCSSHITPDLFQKIVFGAAKDAGRLVQIIQKTSHAFDHPINIYHPEGEYLKGLVVRVSEDC